MAKILVQHMEQKIKELEKKEKKREGGGGELL
jgi:hypothetical protein